MLISPELLIVAALILFFAALFHGSIGTGFPIIATPLLALFTDLQSAIIFTLIPTLLVNLVSIASEGNVIQALKQHLPLALYALLGSALGTLLLLSFSADLFKVLLAIAILAYLLANRIKLDLVWVRRYPKAAKFGFGIAAGILGGLTNVMVPILIIYTLESRYSKKDIIQANNLCFLFGKLAQIALFTVAGAFDQQALATTSLMLLPTSIAIVLGIAIKKKINVEVYKKILRVFLLAIAVLILFQVSV